MLKILVERYGTIGDTIFASAFFRELRKNLPDAQIDIIADKASRPVIENCPYIDNIIDFPSGKYRKYLDYFRLLKTLKQYDTIYCLKRSHFIAKLASLAGIKNRVGFTNKNKRNKYMKLTIPYNEDKHEIDYYLELLKLTNLKVENNKTECWLPKNTSEKVTNYLNKSEGRKRVLIQAYSRYLIKDWFDEYWIEVIKYLANELNVQVYYAGGGKDKLNYEKLNSKLSDISIKPINTSAELSFPETMCLVKNMDLVIGIDSCISHVAAALNVPQIFLHGSTSLTRWKPRSEKCIVLSKNFSCSPCAIQFEENPVCNGTKDCMKAITPDLVINEILKRPL